MGGDLSATTGEFTNSFASPDSVNGAAANLAWVGLLFGLRTTAGLCTNCTVVDTNQAVNSGTLNLVNTYEFTDVGDISKYLEGTGPPVNGWDTNIWVFDGVNYPELK